MKDLLQMTLLGAVMGASYHIFRHKLERLGSSSDVDDEHTFVRDDVQIASILGRFKRISGISENASTYESLMTTANEFLKIVHVDKAAGNQFRANRLKSKTRQLCLSMCDVAKQQRDPELVRSAASLHLEIPFLIQQCDDHLRNMYMEN